MMMVCTCFHVCKYTFYVHEAYFTEAVVGLGRTSYTVLENVSMVEVCTIVYSPSLPCPIDHPFNVRFSTADGVAGSV